MKKYVVELGAKLVDINGNVIVPFRGIPQQEIKRVVRNLKKEFFTRNEADEYVLYSSNFFIKQSDVDIWLFNTMSGLEWGLKQKESSEFNGSKWVSAHRIVEE